MANEQNLKPFKKGQITNPKGRPKGSLNFKTRAKWLLESEEEIVHPVTGEKVMISITDQIDVQLIRAARKGQPWAIREILDRLEGKAAQGVDVTSGGEKIEGLAIIKNNDDSTIGVAKQSN